MEKEKLVVCKLCGKEFLNTKSNKIYCSRICANIASNRAKRARIKEKISEAGTDCPYNDAVHCRERKCNACGWNPAVAQVRAEKIRKKMKQPNYAKGNKNRGK